MPMSNALLLPLWYPNAVFSNEYAYISWKG